MATCKECLHYEACVLNEAYWVKHNADQACSVFKDKSKYVEQKQGRNLKEDTPSLFECSICHWSCFDTYCGDGDYNYCPNCGAKMDGEQ